MAKKEKFIKVGEVRGGVPPLRTSSFPIKEERRELRSSRFIVKFLKAQSESSPQINYNIGIVIDKVMKRVFLFDSCPWVVKRKSGFPDNPKFCKHLGFLISSYRKYFENWDYTKITIFAGSSKQKLERFEKEAIKVVENYEPESETEEEENSKKDTDIEIVNGTLIGEKEKNILKILEKFVFESRFQDSILALLFGPPGTGKTTLMNFFLESIEKEKKAIVKTISSSPDDPLAYSEVLKGGDSLKDGKVIFKKGILVEGLEEAYKKGLPLVIGIHEGNRTVSLNSLDEIIRMIGDEKAIVIKTAGVPDIQLPLEGKVEDGKTVYKYKVPIPVKFIVTGNLGAEYQVSEVPPPLMGRSLPIYLGYYSTREIEKILKLKNFSKKEIEKISALYQIFTNLYTNKVIPFVPRLTILANVVSMFFSFSNKEIGVDFCIKSLLEALKENGISYTEESDLYQNIKAILMKE